MMLRCLLPWILNILVVATGNKTIGHDRWPESQLSQTVGHYPGSYCKLTHLMLIPDGTTGKFYTRNALDVSGTCVNTVRVWDFDHQADLKTTQCHIIFDEGHIFTFFYYYGQSNYFHLHYDTSIPLYKAVYRPAEVDKGHWEREARITRAFLPTVEIRRLEHTNWDTDAFALKHAGKYWADIIKTVVGNHTFLPLDQNFLDANKTICFRKAFFGGPSWKNDSPNLIHQYLGHVLRSLQTFPSDIFGDTPPKIGIVHRAGRRKILNEDELVTVLSELAETELVTFDGLTYKQQVALMQDYRVLIAMNGAGLMNCLYLPEISTCIQLVPYKAHLNYGPYGDLLKARGPYLEWHNTHEENHFHHGTGSHADDTIVHADELKELVKKALVMSDEIIETKRRDEL